MGCLIETLEEQPLDQLALIYRVGQAALRQLPGHPCDVTACLFCGYWLLLALG